MLTGDCWEGGGSEELLTLRGAKTMVLVLFIFALLSLFVFCYAFCFLLFTFDINQLINYFILILLEYLKSLINIIIK